MAAPKRSPVQREHDLERISELYLRGKRQVDIAEALDLSQQQVSYDLAQIQKRWRTQTAFNLDEAKQRELARIDTLERTYWEAWERSCGERTKTRTARQASVDSASVEREILFGNPAFLAGIERCIKLRCDLLGLFAPTRSTVDQVTKVLVEFADDPLAAPDAAASLDSA